LALVEIAIERLAGGAVMVPVEPERIRHPAGDTVGASPLDEHLHAPGVPVERIDPWRGRQETDQAVALDPQL
jgi:hypothetical protein